MGHAPGPHRAVCRNKELTLRCWFRTADGLAPGTVAVSGDHPAALAEEGSPGTRCAEARDAAGHPPVRSPNSERRLAAGDRSGRARAPCTGVTLSGVLPASQHPSQHTRVRDSRETRLGDAQPAHEGGCS